MSKELPQKWKNHINQMCDYARKSEQLRTEFENCLVKKKLLSEEELAMGGHEFEDPIIDSMQTRNGEGLVIIVENMLNGRDILDGSRLEGFK